MISDNAGSASRPSSRKIIHLDMDCFYAAVEMREQPELAELPLAVGGGSPRGVVTTCNYKAREFGIRSAMPGFKARELCPSLVFLPVRFDLYREVSAQIRAILLAYTPLMEPLSLDEAYLDVSEDGRYAWDIAKEIRTRILKETGLTSSAGIAPNKMLAKIASDWRKPNGQFAVLPEQVTEFMWSLPVRKVWGVGPKSGEKFAAQGIKTCGDLQKYSLIEMASLHGKWGEELFHLCRGVDDRSVEPNRPRKSLSNERTYGENLTSLDDCNRAMIELVRELHEDLQNKEADRPIRKAFIKLKFFDFSRHTRECVCSHPTEDVFMRLLAEAYASLKREGSPIRLLGAGVRFAEVPEAELFTQDLLF